MPADAPPSVSVLLAVRDGADLLPQQLAALAGQSFDRPWELVAADNGSRDRTLEVLEDHRSRFPRLVVVDAGARPGRSASLNAAARAATGASLLFVDHDDVVAAGWLAAMAAGLARWDAVGARLEHRRLNPSWTVRHRQEPQSDALPRLPGAAWPHTWGCAMGVRRDWHERVGGFDSSHDGAEDIDYCWRLQDAGARLGFVPDAVLHYRHRTGLRDLYRQSRGYALQTALVRADPRWEGHVDPLPAPRQELRAWAGLVKRVPVPPDRERLGLFLWVLGERVGSVAGRRRSRRAG